MIAPRYIPTHLQTVHHDQDFTKHQKKLAEIQGDDRKKRVIDKEGPAKQKLFETREKNLKFHNSEKLIAIEKDNELLLGRLVEISRKKKNDFVGLSKSTNLPKTLNGPSRQREKDRIAYENEAFAKRLLSQQALFNRKKLEVDYGKHLSLVKQMQRLDNPSTRKLKLPPLKEKTTHPNEDEKEDLAEEEERREKEAQAKKDKERKEKEEKEKHEKEEKEKKEKEDAEKLKKEHEEKEKKEKEEKEKKEKEDAEKLKKENEEKEKAAAATTQDKEQTPKEGVAEQETKEEKEKAGESNN